MISAIFLILTAQASAQGTTKKGKKVFDHKVNICHATASVTNPYVAITVAQSSVAELHNHLLRGNGHGLHEGPVFDPTKDYVAKEKKWGDIIPPLINEDGSVRFAGLNADAHAEWWGRGCGLPTAPTPEGPPADMSDVPEGEANVPSADGKKDFPPGLSKKNVKIQGTIKKKDGESFMDKQKAIQGALDKKFGAGKFKTTVDTDGGVTVTAQGGSMLLELDIDEASAILADFDIDGVEQTWEQISDAPATTQPSNNDQGNAASTALLSVWIAVSAVVGRFAC